MRTFMRRGSVIALAVLALCGCSAASSSDVAPRPRTDSTRTQRSAPSTTPSTKPAPPPVASVDGCELATRPGTPPTACEAEELGAVVPEMSSPGRLFTVGVKDLGTSVIVVLASSRRAPASVGTVLKYADLAQQLATDRVDVPLTRPKRGIPRRQRFSVTPSGLETHYYVLHSQTPAIAAKVFKDAPGINGGLPVKAFTAGPYGSGPGASATVSVIWTKEQNASKFQSSIATEVCQSTVDVNPDAFAFDPRYSRLATDGHESICNGFGKAVWQARDGASYPEYLAFLAGYTGGVAKVADWPKYTPVSRSLYNTLPRPN